MKTPISGQILYYSYCNIVDSIKQHLFLIFYILNKIVPSAPCFDSKFAHIGLFSEFITHFIHPPFFAFKFREFHNNFEISRLFFPSGFSGFANSILCFR